METRDHIAQFAAYCVGSVLGDHDPRADAERDLVLTDDAAHVHWRGRYSEYQQMAGRGVFAGTPYRVLTPSDDDLKALFSHESDKVAVEAFLEYQSRHPDEFPPCDRDGTRLPDTDDGPEAA